jgi:hypothetical protein
MKERELTGNKKFEMVKEECERSLGRLEVLIVVMVVVVVSVVVLVVVV